jgi:hypothetical protein
VILATLTHVFLYKIFIFGSTKEFFFVWKRSKVIWLVLRLFSGADSPNDVSPNDVSPNNFFPK